MLELQDVHVGYGFDMGNGTRFGEYATVRLEVGPAGLKDWRSRKGGWL